MVKRIVVIAVLAALAGLVVKNIGPDVRRYLRMRRM
ncbi:DUF6893 family small protein [Amycolatopsis cynarae]